MKLDGKLLKGIQIWAQRGRRPQQFLVLRCSDRALRYPNLYPLPETAPAVVVSYSPGAQYRGVEVYPSADVGASRLTRTAEILRDYRPVSPRSVPWAVFNVLDEAVDRLTTAEPLAPHSEPHRVTAPDPASWPTSPDGQPLGLREAQALHARP